MTTRAPIHARRLAAALLLAFAALLAAPPDASAQTEVWSATLTVGSQYLSGPDITLYGWNDSGDYTGASLTDEEFTFDGHTYNLDEITSGQTLYLAFDNFGDLATEATRNKLTLHVGSQSFNLGAAALAVEANGISWSTNRPDWSSATTVALRITTNTQTSRILVSNTAGSER